MSGDGEVVVAVIRDGDRIWVQRRREAGELDGCWEFPGGKCEPGEEAAAAVLREVREETGARIVVGDLLDVRAHAYGDRRVRLRFFAATLASGSPVPAAADAADGAWLTPAELLERDIPAANRELVGRLAAPSA